MGKKRIVKEESPADVAVDKEERKEEETKVSRKRIDSGVLYVESTYNNTKLTLTDSKNNTLAWSSSGSLGFKGAKKGTPFAAAKVVVKGVGSGRESAIRGFISKGINLTTIQDKTPVPHNGPKPPKPRRT